MIEGSFFFLFKFNVYMEPFGLWQTLTEGVRAYDVRQILDKAGYKYTHLSTSWECFMECDELFERLRFSYAEIPGSG